MPIRARRVRARKYEIIILTTKTSKTAAATTMIITTTTIIITVMNIAICCCCYCCCYFRPRVRFFRSRCYRPRRFWFISKGFAMVARALWGACFCYCSIDEIAPTALPIRTIMDGRRSAAHRWAAGRCQCAVSLPVHSHPTFSSATLPLTADPPTGLWQLPDRPLLCPNSNSWQGAPLFHKDTAGNTQ